MNTYAKYCPNVYVAKCDEEHEKGDLIEVTTKYGKENECVVHNLVAQKDGFYYYSITRADGYNLHERAKRKAEQYRRSASVADAKIQHYFDRSNKDRDFLSLGEPVKVGHHSEKRHRKAIEDAWNNMGKSVEMHDKARAFEQKANDWELHTEDINLSMPESLGYYTEMHAKAVEYHEGVKSGKYPREHAYTLTYAKKAVNELAKKVEIATKLWGETE